MTPEKLKELRAMVVAMRVENHPDWCDKQNILALIDAELDMHSTAEIAGTRAGLAALDKEALRAQLAEVTRAARELIEAIDARVFDGEDPPLKYTVPWDKATALRAALEPKP